MKCKLYGRKLSFDCARVKDGSGNPFYGAAQRSRKKIAADSLAEGNAQIIIN